MLEFVEGSNRITADILDLYEQIVGPGPLMTCLDLNYDALLNQPGSYTARFPANDPRLAYLQLKKHTLEFYYDGAMIFNGTADSWDYQLDNEGRQTLVVSGRDLLGELAEVPIINFPLEDGAAAIFDAPQQIMLYGSISSGWGFSGAGTTATGVYASLVGEPVLSALTRIAEHIGESFRVDNRRTLHWVGAGSESSGVRAIQTAGDPLPAEGNPFVCFIQRLSERRDSTRMITTIYPQGSGLGETQLNLEGTSRVAPAGFTLDEVNNSLTSNAALTYMGGQVRGRRVDFKDIRPLYNTDADVISAKDYLFDAALAYLQRNDSVDDVVEYDLDVVQLPRHVRVGMTLRVVYQDDYRTIDQDLFILGIRTTIGSDGAVTRSLTVAPINQWRLKETSRLTAQIEEGEIFAAHPQIDANTYWMTFREEVGSDQTDHIAEFPFYLGAEVQTIRQVLFRYKVDRILALVKSYALAGANTEQNTTALATDPGTAATTDPNSTALATNPGAAATTDPNSAALATDPGTAATTDPNSVALVTDPGAAATTDLNTLVNTGNNSVAGDPHVHSMGQHAHNSSATHFHNIPSHTHNSSVGHFHSIPAHTHNSTATHFHSIPAHTHNSSTGHFHSIPAHVHALPALTASYTIERVSSLNSYVLADLEYSVNGGEWANLAAGVPVAGGYYLLDITAAIQNPSGLKRPYQPDNLVQVRRTTAAGGSKSALVRAQIGIRQTVQSIVTYS